MDILMEIVFELYLELMMLIVPEEKTTSKKYRIIAIFIALAVILCVLALFIWGCVLLIDYNNKLGIIPISVALLISIIQIIAGVVFYFKKSKIK